MAFTLTLDSPLPPAEAFARLADLGAHGEHVPLTTMHPDPGTPRLGWGVVARTAVGPVGFDDSMLVTDWQPGRLYRVVKTGRVLTGWAEVEVTPDGRGGSRVRWTEELALAAPGLARLTRPLGDRLGPRLFRRVIERLLAEGAP